MCVAECGRQSLACFIIIILYRGLGTGPVSGLLFKSLLPPHKNRKCKWKYKEGCSLKYYACTACTCATIIIKT
jgi:hypothetical protein